MFGQNCGNTQNRNYFVFTMFVKKKATFLCKIKSNIIYLFLKHCYVIPYDYNERKKNSIVKKNYTYIPIYK